MADTVQADRRPGARRPAMIVHIAGDRIRIRAGTMAAWARQGTILALVAAIGCSGARTPSAGGAAGQGTAPAGAAAGPAGTPGASAREATGPGAAYAPLPEGPRVDPAVWPATYDEASSRLERLMSMVRSLTGLVDPASVDVAARAERSGGSVQAAFAFVRDEVKFEPYAGVLRGGRGALIAGAGNAVDKSLLLAALLEARGHRTRIARGTLDDNRVETLLKAWEGTPVTAVPSLDDESSRAVQAFGEPKFAAQIDAARTRATGVRQWVLDRTAADAEQLRGAVGDSAGWFTDAAASRVRAQLRQHCWVQVEQGGAWLDLDPSFPSAQPGERFAESSATFGRANPPADLSQTVRFTVTAERLRAGKRAETVVLDVSIPAQELVTQQVRLTNEPAEPSQPQNLGRANQFRAVLTAGKRRQVGSTYALDESRGGPGSLPNIGGSLFAETPPPPGGLLTGLWLEIKLTGPGGPPIVERRYFIDRVGASGRTQPALDGPVQEIQPEKLAYLAVRNYDILVLPAPYPASVGAWLGARFIVDSQRLFRLALDVRFGKAKAESLAATAARGAFFSPSLMAFGSTVSERLRAAGPGERLVLQRPFVAMTKQAFAGGEDAGAQFRSEEGLDIVSPGAVPFGGSTQQRAASGLAFGVFLTNLELAAATQLAAGQDARITNASRALAAARAAGNRLVVVKDAAADVGVKASPEALAAGARDLKRGYLVVTSTQGGAAAPSDFTWWRVDRDSGVALGVAQSGEGQGEAEYAGTAAAIGGMVWCQTKNYQIARDDEKRGAERVIVGQAACVALGAIGIATAWAPTMFLILVGSLLGIGGDLCGLF